MASLLVGRACGEVERVHMSEKSKVRVMIIGGNLVGKGAEAMLLVVRNAIKAAVPESILYMPLACQADSEQLKKYGFEIVKQRQQGLIVKAVSFGLLMTRLLRQGWIDPTAAKEKGIANIFRVSNIVVDIAGFASSDQWGSRAAFGRWRQYALSKSVGNKIIFMPQSWGPFKNKSVSLFTRAMLRDAQLVCAREKISYDHLIESGCVKPQKILLSPDLAFQFRASPSKRGQRILHEAGLTDRNRPIITMTPNMRIFERTPGQGANNTYLSTLIDVITHFLHKTPCQIVLIPHEASYRRANDTELCKMIIEQIQDRERVCMLRADRSAADIKAVIGLSEFLVASRYHSLIGALSMRTPAAVIGWSHKYDEVMRELGLEQWVVDLVRQPANSTTDVVLKAWEKRDAIRKVLQERVPELEKKSALALDRMIDIIKFAVTL